MIQKKIETRRLIKDDVLNGSESLFAAFAQNTVLIHDEFKQSAISETKNTSGMLEISKQVINFTKKIL